MIAEAWQGTFVSRHTVDVTAGEVKKVLGEYGQWIVNRPKVGYSLDVPSSDELVRKGWHFFSRRTKQGAERAIECFLEASAQYPGDFKALEGLSTCYLMQAVFGIRQPLEAYAQFLEAHERAVAAGGLTPELRCNRAHGLNLFEHRPHEAEVELLTGAGGQAVVRARPTCGWPFCMRRLATWTRRWPRCSGRTRSTHCSRRCRPPT